MTLPDLTYRPRDPRRYRPAIGVIGCGNIARRHLAAYREAGYRVTALSDVMLERAEGRREAFFPDARVFADYRELLARPEIEVVDVTTHPEARAGIVEAALRAGKHVLSQKPFVLDLEVGERLVRLADAQGVRLAVNQNARWAPHHAYMRAAVEAGLLGELSSLDFVLHFDHNWTARTPFDAIHHLLLYDYAIHWFDLIHLLVGRPAERVYAALERSRTQRPRPPLLGQVAIRYPAALATLALDGDTRQGASQTARLVGERATLVSEGAGQNEQQVRLITPEGTYAPTLEGAWYNDGFHGAMAELLCALEEEREPSHAARQNLGGLALCFAALDSADSGEPRRPGEVLRVAPGAGRADPLTPL